jgi:U3 small nucleolar RNA-associated protein 20
VNIVDVTLAARDPLSDYVDSESNSSWIIGSCLSCLAHRSDTEWHNQVDIAQWTARVVKNWCWSGYTLNGLVSLINALCVQIFTFLSNILNCSHSQIFGDQVPFDAFYAQLQPSLLSHSRLLRLSALRLLSSRIVGPSTSSEVLHKCLQAEEVMVDVQGVRERVMRIGRISHIIKDGDDTGADIAVRWLLGVFRFIM